jgi:hypothetical protein
MPPRHGVQVLSASVAVMVYPPWRVALSAAWNEIIR